MRPTVPAGLGVGTAVRRLAERAGITEGQAYTLIIGLVLGLVTAAIGIPPTLRDRFEPLAGGRAAAAAPGGTTEAAGPVDQAAPATPEAPPTAYLVGGGAGATTPSTDLSFGSSGGSTGSTGSTGSADGGSTGESTGGSAPSAPGGISRLASLAAGPPGGIAVDERSGAFYVATDDAGAGPSKIVRFGRSGEVEREYPVQGQPAGRSRGVVGVALDGDGGIVAADASSARVLRIALDGGAQRVLATIPDVPTCIAPGAACELSPRNAAPILHSVAIGDGGTVYVADAGQGIVWRIGAAGKPEPWLRDPQLLSPDGRGPAGLAFDTNGDLLVVVSRSIVALTGAVLRVPVDESGAAGAPAEVYRSDPDAGLAGIAVGTDGSIFVAATGADALLVLDAQGALVRTVTAPELERPVGVARRAASVLVTGGDGVVARVPD